MCSQCPSKVVLFFQGAAIVIAVLFVLWKFASNAGAIPAEIKILFQAAQIIGTYPSMNLVFPPVLYNALNVFSLTNINIELFSPECSTPFTFWEKFVLKQFFPLISIFSTYIISVTIKIVRRRSTLTLATLREVMDLRTLRRQFFMIWSTVSISLYTLTVSGWLEAFLCQPQPDGSYSLLKSPSLQCYDAEWKSNLGWIVLFGIINFLVIPGVLLRKMNQLRLKILTGATQKRYSYLVGSYHPKYFYWELVLLLKRTCILISLTVFTSDTVKYLLAVVSQFIFTFLDVLNMPYKRESSNHLMIIWNFLSMLLLISSRLVFTFDDVGDTEKRNIGIVFILFLSLMLFRTMMQILSNWLKKTHPFVISADQLEQLDENEQLLLSTAYLDFVTSSGVFEIEQDVARTSDAADVFNELFPPRPSSKRKFNIARPVIFQIMNYTTKPL
eukprot:TRINITY_DN21842_c0_g1_i1.p1 TRINITY_DN21842_c0_g1~~TRINITY_DN21842_c0_g1_i1.p1  ORF type:complete len:501 (-),score=106.70 TRINITY_DN21842_c0_g1_i1:41-1369(-)